MKKNQPDHILRVPVTGYGPLRALMMILLMCMSVMLAGQVNVTKIEGASGYKDRNGFIYALPANGIQVHLVVEKQAHVKGPYSEFAEKYLGIEEVINVDHNIYDITDVRMSAFAIADPQHFYFAEIDEKLIREGKSLRVSFSENGLLAGYDATADAGREGEASVVKKAGKEDAESPFSYYAGANRVRMIDTVITRVVVDTLEVERIYYDERWELKSDEKKAEEAAAAIQRIRESRYNLLTGYQEIPYPSGTISYMDKELVEMEKEYISLFTGVTIRTEHRYSFSIVPGVMESSEISVPVFSFSEQLGVRDPNSPAGIKVSLLIKSTGDRSGLDETLNLRNDGTGNERGFYYRIPKEVFVSLEPDFDTDAKSYFTISQFGSVTYLPPGVTRVLFHPETGMVKDIILQ